MGRKKSNFPALTGVPNDATLDFVSNGTNYKITIADFLAALGVTGTIKQDGDPTGTPILDPQGSQNIIRNLEAGPGIKTAVSAQNGATISHNLSQGSGGGVQVLTNVAEASPTVRSIVAGAGIQVFANNGSLTIQSTGATPSTGVVLVSSLSDLPTPVGDTITLAADTTYDPQGLIDISPYRLVVDSLTVQLSSRNRLSRGFTSDTTGAVLTVTGVNSLAIVKEMLLLAPNGKAFAVDSGGGIVFNDVVNYLAASASTIADSAVVSFRNYSIIDFGLASPPKGIVWSGFCRELNISNGLYQDWGGDLFDFGSVVFTNGFTIGANVRFSHISTNVALKGSAANIPAGAVGLVIGNRFTGTTTPTSGFDQTTIGFDFQHNQGVPNSMVFAVAGLSGNASVTTLVTSSWVQVAGTLVAATNIERAQIGGSNQLQLLNESQKKGTVLASVDLTSVGSGTYDYKVAVFRNGTQLQLAGGSPVEKRVVLGPTTETLVVTAPLTYISGDLLDIRIYRVSGTNNITVTNAVLQVQQ